VDVAYGGENGFNQAIELTEEKLHNVKFVQEKKLLRGFMEEIARDTGKISIGLKETMYALEAGAVETLILWENLDDTRYVVRNPLTQVLKKIYLRKEQRKDSASFVDKGIELDVIEKEPLIEYVVRHFKEYGTSLAFVTERSPLGNQFVKGFGGIGAILRYKFDCQLLLEADDCAIENAESEDDSFDEDESEEDEVEQHNFEVESETEEEDEEEHKEEKKNMKEKEEEDKEKKAQNMNNKIEMEEEY